MSSLASTTANDPIVQPAEDAPSGQTDLLAEQFNDDPERTLIGTLKMLSRAEQDAERRWIPGLPPLVMCNRGLCEPPRPRPGLHHSACSADCLFSSCSGKGTCSCSLGSAKCGPRLAAAPSSSSEQRKNLDWFIALSESASAPDLAASARELREALALGEAAAIAQAAEALECEAEALTDAP